MDMDKEAREEESRGGKREVEREEEKTVVTRRCANCFPKATLRILVPWRCLGCLVILGVGLRGRQGCRVRVRSLFLRGWWVWVLTPLLFLIVIVLYRSPFLSPESVEPSFMEESRRYEHGGLAPRRAAVVEKEDSRSGLRSRPQVGCGLPVGRKKDASVTWTTVKYQR